MNGHFYNPTKGDLTFDEVTGEIIDYIAKKPEKFYDIIVGCDSSSEREPSFPVVVAILRVGEGGRFFIKKIHYKNRLFFNYHQRVLEEVLLSIELAQTLRATLDKKLKEITIPLDYQFRYIHADVGEQGATRDMVKEIMGLIWGNGFEPKIKPEAYVASVVADRYT